MGTQISLLNVRRSIMIGASPVRVWEEFASFDRICAWLSRGHTVHTFESRLGGSVDLSAEIDGTHIELFHHGFERPGVDAADNLEGYEEGWDVKHLIALRAIVER